MSKQGGLVANFKELSFDIFMIDFDFIPLEKLSYCRFYCYRNNFKVLNTSIYLEGF